MTLSRRRMLIVNFAGLGNGLCVLPLLKRLEEVDDTWLYFHTSNPVFAERRIMRWFRLRNFEGTVPLAWRRFDPADWPAIESFLRSKTIDLIVNLRNQGPLGDIGYFRFKKECSWPGLEFWELDQATITKRVHHSLAVWDQVGLFASKGIDLRLFNRKWLCDYVRSSGANQVRRFEVGLFTGASQPIKRWPVEQWVQLGALILGRTNRNLVIYAGADRSEIADAQEIVRQLQHQFAVERSKLLAGQPLDLLAVHMSGLDLLVSNDTCAVHAAVALDIPVIGLYFATDSSIWGGSGDKFVSVQGQVGLNCLAFKVDAGNCAAFYGGCPGPCRGDVKSSLVYEYVEQALGIARQSKTEKRFAHVFSAVEKGHLSLCQRP